MFKLANIVAFSVSMLGLGNAEALSPGNLAHGSGQCDLAGKPFCDAAMSIPSGWQGPIFRLSQSYPQSHARENYPWLRIDPRIKPLEYITAALQYFYEGNVHPKDEESFDPLKNPVRRWYHAPWQSVGMNGREFVHGLTRERSSRPGELHPNQKKIWNNYAVGFYNAPGGVTIGKVWANPANPNPSAARFPEGTVSVKLLFTTATAQDVPYLAGAPEWTAYIFADPNAQNPTPTSPKSLQKVRLLQIDIAIRDFRVDNTTGWVFGTFVYGGGPGGTAGIGWGNIRPIGAMWGNDPGYSGTGALKETFLNPDVRMPHVGYKGRLNGPVDNPNSSCLSCHSTAQSPSGVMIPPQGGNPALWFRNIPSGQPFDAGGISLDYSLQLSVGINNFKASASMLKPQSKSQLLNLRREMYRDSRPPRDGGSFH